MYNACTLLVYYLHVHVLSCTCTYYLHIRVHACAVFYAIQCAYTFLVHIHTVHSCACLLYMYYLHVHACTYPLLCTCMMHVHVSYTLYMYNVHVQCVGWIFIRELDHDSSIFQFCYWNFCVFGKSVMT